MLKLSPFPILMYHNVVDDTRKSVDLTISVEKLEQQFKYLSDHKYTTFHFSELELLEKIPFKSVVLIFDDVTECHFNYAYPLLKKYNLKATYAIPFKYIGQTDVWNDGTKKIMCLEQLKSLDANIVELAHHSFEHRAYSSLNEREIDEDFTNCYSVIKDGQLNVSPVLAYPYGNYPKKGLANVNFKKALEKNHIKFGLRIGNRPNLFPFKDKYEIKRIDIKGQDSLLAFKFKLRVGKIGLF